ncbi:MAG: FAD-binding oxidoreductase [Verrucomicrobiota bacterium]
MTTPVQTHPEATAELLRTLGPSRVLTDEATCFAASFDNMRLSFMPEAVVRPAAEEDVGVVLRLANRHKVPVTVRGRGTGNTGASSPIHGGWVIHLDHWDRIEIDPVAAMAKVQPGAITARINDAAEPHGLFFPPDPSSIKHCSIGGNIATNAGGLRAAKYGVVRDHVYALEGFLPTGEKVRWAAPLRKFVSGLNLRDLWIGSEGTLGVITSATLKLVPLPAARRTFLVAFRTDEGALEAAAELMRLRLNPAVLEFLDTQTVAAAERHRGARVFTSAELGSEETHAVLLLELDGHPAALADDAAKARQWIARQAAASRETDDPAEAERLWDIRRTCSQAMYALGNAKLNEDVVVPFRSYVPLIRYTRELRDRLGLATPTFGHAADGNFHVHIMYDRDDAEHRRKAETAIHEVMTKVVELGGAITGEHGIGIAKSPFLRLQHTSAEVGAMLAVKRALDPNGILAPGQIFEPMNVWEHRPVKVTLPWDKH